MSSDPSNIPLQIQFLIIIAMVISNGLVVLTNTAMNTVSRSKVSQMADEDEKASVLKALLERPTDYRFTNRLLSYIFIAVGLFFTIGLPYEDILSVVVFVAVSIVFSEFFTRKIAQQHSEAAALAMLPLERFFLIVLKPFVVLLTLIANLFLKMFRQDTDIQYSGYSEDRVMSILEAGQQSGEIKEEGKKMINSIFQFDDELAYEIMTPRTDVFLIDINDPTDEYLDELMELRYSRIPVCEDDTDNIIGILHIKDYLIKARETGFDKVDIRSILRKPYFVPETKNIDSLFYELQIEKQHIAILIDEYGGFSGIVTMEDIIEEIVGDIDDEYDQEEHIIEKIDDNHYLVDGNVSLNDLCEETEINLESESSETIGGFIIDILGEIPEEGDENRDISFENYIFTILSVKERRIEKVKIHIKPPVMEKDEEDE
ncbi:hemolysin family protein [Ihubacter sp. mB4P-1]|uniref:hemolysin family protein n=1 Tax=Ihubacter sp. mB4P-1 TaxID=3242370 RepID=UPI00137A293E